MKPTNFVIGRGRIILEVVTTLNILAVENESIQNKDTKDTKGPTAHLY